MKWFASLIAGQSPPSNEVDDFTGEGLPFLQGNAEFGSEYPTPVHRCDTARKRVRAGDILLSVRAPVGALNIANRSYGIGRGLAAVRPGRHLDRRFCWWWMHSVIEELRTSATGSTYEAVTTHDIGALGIPRAAMHTQRAIADFLDAETIRIDALIAKKRRLIDLFGQRFWESITVAIRESGTTMIPLRRFITRINDGPFGSSLTSSHYVEEGPRVVRLGNIGFGEFKDEDKACIPWSHYETLWRHRVSPGDLLIAGLGDSRNHVGRACVAPDLGPAIVKADCYCATVDRSRALPEFLALFLSSLMGSDCVALAARGTTRSRINLDIAKEIVVPWMEIERQEHLVDEAARRRARVLRGCERLAAQIALLRERRQTLITAAVTGELEIPGVAA